MQNVAPIFNPMHLTLRGPTEIIPHHVLRRATAEEISVIRKAIERFSPYPSFIAIPHYEARAIKTPTEHGHQITWVPAPQEEWRYNVIALETNDLNKLNELQLVSNVCTIQFILPYLMLEGHGSAGNAWQLAHFLATNLSLCEEYPTFDETNVRDMQEAHSEMLAVRTEFPEIARALELLDALNSLPPNSDFEVLGLFAIVEMLITHNPKLEDLGDSITHQMRAKFPLLSRRFKRPLDYSRFGGLDENKVWSKLYAYRSSIAHGGIPNFSSGDLQVLKSRGDAVTFLREAVRALIRHSLKEPQLYRDLKEC